MSIHAGFANIAQISQNTVQDLVRTYYEAGVLPSSFQGTTVFPPPTGGPPINIQYELYMDLPIVTFNNDPPNTVTIAATFLGRIAFGAGAFQNIKADVQFLASPRADITGTGFRVGIDPATLTIPSITITVLSGFVPDVLIDFIQSATGRALIAALVSTNVLQDFQHSSMPMEFPTLPQLGKPSFSSVVLRVQDDCLSLAADVTGSYFDTDPNETFVKVATQGNAELIKSNLSNLSMNFFVSSAIAPLLWRPLIDQLNEKLQTKNVEIKFFKLVFEQGNFHISGQGREGPLGEHAADFSFRVRVLLGTPDQVVLNEDEYGQQWTDVIPGQDSLVLDAYDVDIDPLASGSLWEVLGVIGIMTVAFPAAPVLLWAVRRIVDDIVSGFEQKGEQFIDSQALGELSQWITLTESKGPLFLRQISSFKVHPQGLLFRINLLPHWKNKIAPLGNVIGPVIVDIEKSMEPLTYRFEWAQDAGWQTNPMISVRWQVHRNDNGKVIASQDLFQSQPGALEFKFSLSNQNVNECVFYKISCRLYLFKEVFNQTVTLRIADELNKKFPFVSWEHDVNAPVVVVGKNGQAKELGNHVVHRKSAIHRTDFPGRCRSAALIGHDPKITYHEKLPFPLKEIANQRHQICDYCFYGGPDKNQLRADAQAILNK